MKRNKYENEEEEEDEDAVAERSSREKTAAMVKWTQRSAFFLGFCAFIIMFLASFDFINYFDTGMIVKAFIKGMCAGLLFWMAGLIIGNILIKGLITDIPVDNSHLVEGGVLQRVYLFQQRLNYDTDGNVIQIDPRTDSIVRKNAADGAKDK